MNKDKSRYIAGPMSGLPHHNFPAFDKAKKQLEARGFKVVSPADIDREEFGMDPDNVNMTPELLDRIILRDVKAVLDCEGGIIMIDGWENSKGANAEIKIAAWANHDIYIYDVARDHLTRNTKNGATVS